LNNKTIVTKLIQSNNLKIFICHASEDADFALKLFNMSKEIRSVFATYWISIERESTINKYGNWLTKEI